jgi:hypothetical protein
MLALGSFVFKPWLVKWEAPSTEGSLTAALHLMYKHDAVDSNCSAPTIIGECTFAQMSELICNNPLYNM